MPVTNATINLEYNSITGEPLNDAYLECDLPTYLQRDIDALLSAINNNVLHIDCYEDEIEGSINSALIDELISNKQAIYLRKKYLGYIE